MVTSIVEWALVLIIFLTDNTMTITSLVIILIIEYGFSLSLRDMSSVNTRGTKATPSVVLTSNIQ